MANYAEIDFIVESDDVLIAPEGESIDHDTALALATDMAEMIKYCNSDRELFQLATKYFEDRPGVMDDDVADPHLQAHRTVIQHHLFMVVLHTSSRLGIEPDDVRLEFEWQEAGCAVSFGVHKDLSPKKMKVIGRVLGSILESAVKDINNTFKPDEIESDDDAQIDDDVAKALEAIGWDKQSRGEA